MAIAESGPLTLPGPFAPATTPSPVPNPVSSPVSSPVDRPAALARHGRRPAPGWVGVMAVGLAGTWLGVVGAHELLSGGDLAAVVTMAEGRSVGPALMAVVALLMLAEWRRPAVRRPVLSRAHLVDAGYLALFAVVVIPVLTLVETGFAVEVGRHARFLLLGHLAPFPRVAVVAAVLVGMDAMNWVAHVANHRSVSLWRLHALHHSQEEMSVLTTFRTHPVVHATYLGALLPALVLGSGGPVPGAALVAYGCLVTLPHANLRWTLGPLGRVVVSPAYHRLHHVSEELDPRGAVNFGFVLVCWDQLARLARFPGGGPSPATGITGRPVPVEQADTGRRAVATMAIQLAQPFRSHDPMGLR